MEVKQFIKETHNEWVKIEDNDTIIIQKITEYHPTNKPNIFDVQSNILHEIKDLESFYRELHVKD